ncbi:MAG: hypothetical protein WCT35_00115 [Sideroxydans sp.]|jgi:hypothetical protein
MMTDRHLPPDLPVLTEVVGEETWSFPTLTEVVEAPTTPDLDTTIEIERLAPISTESADVLLPEEMPLDISPQLLSHLETHLEDVLAQRLQQRLAEAQQQVISQTLAELKAELPELIRKALATPQDPS